MAFNYKPMLATPYDKDKHNIDGWLLSIKLDGVRGLWSHKVRKMYSRNGKIFSVPEWFTKNFPECDLDGEIYLDIGKFNECSGIVRHKIPNDEEWAKLTYIVFDIQDPRTEDMNYIDRIVFLKNMDLNIQNKYMKILEYWTCKDHLQLITDHTRYEKLGHEGLIVRNPNSLYQRKRSKDLLKVKSFFDEEAVVVGYEEGINRLEGLMGSLTVKNSKGITFSVGTGFNDEERQNPPKIGSTITYKYLEIFKDTGKPRHPVFLSIRDYE